MTRPAKDTCLSGYDLQGTHEPTLPIHEPTLPIHEPTLPIHEPLTSGVPFVLSINDVPEARELYSRADSITSLSSGKNSSKPELLVVHGAILLPAQEWVKQSCAQPRIEGGQSCIGHRIERGNPVLGAGLSARPAASMPGKWRGRAEASMPGRSHNASH